MVYGIWYVRHPRAAIYNCTATRNIFRRPHEETSALSGTTCIIIAESAKPIHSVSLEPDPPTSAALDVIKITSTRAGDLNYIQRCGSRRVWFETNTRSASVSEPVSRKAKYSDRDLGHAPALPRMASY